VYYVAYGHKCGLAPIVTLQIAQQVLLNAGFEVFDPVQPSKVTMAGSHYGAGVMVTVVALDSDGGSATVINAFTANQAAMDSARTMVNEVLVTIQNS